MTLIDMWNTRDRSTLFLVVDSDGTVAYVEDEPAGRWMKSTQLSPQTPTKYVVQGKMVLDGTATTWSLL